MKKLANVMEIKNAEYGVKKVIEKAVILDEFYNIYSTARGIQVYTTDDKPSKILDLLKNNFIVIMMGDYKKAEGILRCIHHYEDNLLSKDDKSYYNSFNMDLNFSAVKRLKIHRINYVFYQNKMPLFTGHINNKK